MRVLVCGDRNWSLKLYLFRMLDIQHSVSPITCIIEGDARGADRMGGEWGVNNNVKVEVYPAQWDRYGRAAGPIRNKQMLDEGKPDLVLAFHENIDQSKGTKNMVNQTKNRNIPFKIYMGV